ncbi:MAG TPA: tetratricopeptide repeat protein, partial [Vicinamibacterales bacterium]|nr:tetratricopeptide repeat protein [Vicinamibacterales bacterium]
MPWRGRAAAPVATFLVLIAAGCSSRRSLPANKLDLIARGDELVKSHQYANAITIYQKAAAIDPVDGTVRMKLAGVYASAGNPMEASTQAMRALDLMPNDAGTRLHVAELMLSASRFIDAADVVAPLRYNPDNADALILWGNATARLFNTTWALYSLADPIRSPTDFDRARLALRQAVTSYEDRAAEQAFRQALALAPDNTDASLALADFLWATGRAVEAEPLLKRVADQMPKHAAVNHALGSYYLSRHQDAEGERYLRNAASADAPYNRAPRFTLAGYYVQVKRDDDALAVLEAMTGEDDAKGAVSLRIAAIHVRHGRGDEALRALGPLLTREPNNADALALEARALVTNNKAHDALGVAEAAVKADPDSSNAKLALGKALAADGDLEGALDPLLEALRLHPADPQIPPTLARTALATGRDNLALLYGRQALRNDPSDRDTALAVVTALIHLHDYSAAENELRALQSRDERSPEVFVDQGTILAARGNQSGARAAYQHALELDGNSLEALTGLVSVDLDDRQIPTARR